MISGPKVFLELFLLIWIVYILHKEGWQTKNSKFLYIFTLLSLLLNSCFYFFGAWGMYVSFGEQQGISLQTLYLMILFDIMKWTILVYFITRFALNTENKISGGGFYLIQKKYSLLKIISIGVISAIIMVIMVNGISYLLFKDGLLDKLSQMKQNTLYLKLGFWGGFRNLIGEEVLTRLGVQTLVLYLLRKKFFAVILSIVVSSFFFELWHNGFREIYLLNFTASMIFAIVFYKYGYESAAIGHCVADWLFLCVVPYILI